jgi:hypothetical protein
MGANPTQAYGVALLFIALTLIAAGLAQNVSVILVLLGFVALAASIAMFLKCKPWEHKEG